MSAPEDVATMVQRPRGAWATLVLAHGAGAGMDTPFMQAIADGLVARRIEVVRFQFAYMARRRALGLRSPPDRMPALEARYRAVLAALPSRRRKPLFIGGKSMGGRVATHIADAAGVRGVVALGYPFHPPKRPGTLRVAHLITLQTPCLIVQGTRDPFGTAEEVPTYALSKRTSMHWLPDGDHSFCTRKASGRTLEQNLASAVDAIARFLQALA